MIKGIILAGGSATRLYPASAVVSKQLLPVYDKPMIYYPLSILMLAGVREILLISTLEDTPRFEKLLKSGSRWGINIQYAVQEKPAGLAQSFLIGEKFIGNDHTVLVLGDNIFYGNQLTHLLQQSFQRKKGATVFAYRVENPERYGVIEFDENQRPISIIEKPKQPKSNYAVTGLYFYDNRVIEFARSLKPSARGELEITDINQLYLDAGDLNVQIMGRGMAWLDTGTFDSLLEASSFIQTLQKRQGIKIACLEEIAFRMGFINEKELSSIAKTLMHNSYGQYLLDILAEKTPFE